MRTLHNLCSMMGSDWFVSSYSIPSSFCQKLEQYNMKRWYNLVYNIDTQHSNIHSAGSSKFALPTKISMHLKITNFEREEINFAVHQDSTSKPDTVFAPIESSTGVRGSQWEGFIDKVWPIRSLQLSSLCNQRRAWLWIGKLHKLKISICQFSLQ